MNNPFCVGDMFKSYDNEFTYRIDSIKGTMMRVVILNNEKHSIVTKAYDIGDFAEQVNNGTIEKM